ncbi:MAG TPA: gas vesicle protein, partial [Nitrolancea sp.]|nr:gas vesicle protein [Nitrolancea sp.]
MSRSLVEEQDVTLLELLDRVIARGVILAGDITISVADVDLIYLGLRVMLSSVDQAERAGLVPGR